MNEQNQTNNNDNLTISVWQSAKNSTLMLLIYSVIVSALLAFVYLQHKAQLEIAANNEKLKQINQILPKELYDNDLIGKSYTLASTNEFGQDKNSIIYLAKKNSQITAVVTEVIAKDGYAGKIKLLVAFARSGEHNSSWQILATRVLEHKETPGLGDYIDIAKDRNKSDPWIKQFDQQDFQRTNINLWAVKKDGGTFTSRTGATITPRAIIKTLKIALEYWQKNGDNILKQLPT